MTTVVGVLLSIGAAYVAGATTTSWTCCSLVFGFVNAPLFATFLLGMFWKRTTATAHSSDWSAAPAAALPLWALTVAEGKGGWIANLYTFPSQMAQNFWIAIIAFVTCVVVSTR
jgi:solute:Na+ symporter, SSS family